MFANRLVQKQQQMLEVIEVVIAIVATIVPPFLQC